MASGIVPNPNVVGPTGPTGAAGTNGATGPTGPTGAGSSVIDEQTFTSSTTYTISASAKFVVLDCIAAGGGGGGGRATTSDTSTGGNGGVGGAWYRIVALASEFTGAQTVTIGAGGTGGASVPSGTAPSNGTSGGTSRFGHLYFAGGICGAAGTSISSTSQLEPTARIGYQCSMMPYWYALLSSVPTPAQNNPVIGLIFGSGGQGRTTNTTNNFWRGVYGFMGGGGGGGGGSQSQRTAGIGGGATTDIGTAVTYTITQVVGSDGTTTSRILPNTEGGGAAGTNSGNNGTAGTAGANGTLPVGGAGGGGGGGHVSGGTSGAGGNGGNYGGGGGGGGSGTGAGGTTGAGGNGGQAVIRLWVLG